MSPLNKGISERGMLADTALTGKMHNLKACKVNAGNQYAFPRTYICETTGPGKKFNAGLGLQ